MGHGNGIRWYHHVELPGDGLVAAAACLSADPPRPPGSSGELYAAANRLGRRAQALRDVLGKLGSIAACDGVWTGAAADTFRRLLDDAHRAHYDQVPERYDGYARALREYGALLEQHQARIDGARADVRSALDAYHRATAAAAARGTAVGQAAAAATACRPALSECQAAAHRFRAAYNDWVDSVTRCERAIERVDGDALHNPHGAHVAVHAVATVSAVLSNLTAVLALATLPWPPVAILFLAVSSATSLIEFGADITRAAVWQEKVTLGDLAFDALGSIPLGPSAAEAVKAGRALKAAGVLTKARAGAGGFLKSFGPELIDAAGRDVKEAAVGLRRTRWRPDVKGVSPTLRENWEVQDVSVTVASVGRDAYNNRTRAWPQALERTAFSVMLGPAGPPAAAGVNVGAARVVRELGKLRRLAAASAP
jgi:uncharacterized protein YukE